MSYVRIPFDPDSDRSQPLKRCIERAATETGSNQFTVSIIMSLFLEEVAEQLVHGQVVSIPGFGLFAPKEIAERHRRMSGDPRPRCKPAFVPSRGFSQQVPHSVPPLPENQRRLGTYTKNHSNKHCGMSQRVYSSMEEFRVHLQRQLNGS